MIDIITSLGADERKLILTGTALSNKFNLLDQNKSTPGSASTGVPSVITYQQVGEQNSGLFSIFTMFHLSFMNVFYLSNAYNQFYLGMSYLKEKQLDCRKR